MSKYLISHFFDVEPSKHGFREIPFITTDETGKYYLGFEKDVEIPKEIIEKNVAEKFYIALEKPKEISDHGSLWISISGEVFISASETPFGERTALHG